VKFVGQRNDVPRLLRLLDVFASSSITEGTPISLLEAMASGVPVVATAVGGNRDLVSHRRTGLLCPPRDVEALAAQIVELLRGPQCGRTLAAAAKQQVVAAYSLETTNSSYTRLYEELLAR
jgi:glycosyltransferase involved in cell wall biosynthesis